MIQAASLSSWRIVRHAFFTRAGGVSTGGFASLNCGASTGDDPANVAANRERVAARLEVAPTALVTAKQVHGANVVVVTKPWSDADRPEADGLVTATPGIALGLLTADCGPILFACPDAEVVGAAHAGWRGALGGVVEAVVDAMERLGAPRSRIFAAVGPAIAAASYEVGPEFPAPFLRDDPASAAFFSAGRADHFHFDLPGYLTSRLLSAGVGRVEPLGLDTFTDSGRFFSHRRSTLANEAQCGRQISAILLDRH